VTSRLGTGMSLAFFYGAPICAKGAENIYAPLVMLSIGARKRTLAGQTVYRNGSIDTSFRPTSMFSFDSTFNVAYLL
jgi:hypothetical protein